MIRWGIEAFVKDYRIRETRAACEKRQRITERIRGTGVGVNTTSVFAPADKKLKTL
jgi:hypothetical protein